MAKKIMIDPGHGGQNSGAVAFGILEKDINLKVSNHLKTFLENSGFTVGMTRTGDTTLDLYSRSKKAKDFGADLLVSVHHNAFKVIEGPMGAETIHTMFIDMAIGKIAKTAAENIMVEFVALGMKRRNVYSKKATDGSNADYYAINKDSYKLGLPGIITEFGFMDSHDRFLFDTDAKLKKEAEAIAKGICKTFSVVFKGEAVAPSVPAASKIVFRVKVNDIQVGAYAEKDNAMARTNDELAKAVPGDKITIENSVTGKVEETFHKEMPKPIEEPKILDKSEPDKVSEKPEAQKDIKSEFNQVEKTFLELLFGLLKKILGK